MNKLSELVPSIREIENITNNNYENVYYVDITKVKNMVYTYDMHHNYDGQQFMAKQIIK